ncbi:bifunctional UDP-3-O-[3-hydroxymyristoyl] N-acetylglucosamine deacetylase/3-hydroxyacyl-ACP dehydratase [bacterium]|nr:bifunctional UDP-3-O-[3-hydroxymyristoyl] N-acetylglucosamine deacetylase/3-hydroxyacyl-ACP dehydratase [bacterium]
MGKMQKTIKKSVSVSGISLHTGKMNRITFNPAPEDTWLKFIRVDLPGKPVVDVTVDNVVEELYRGTNLTQNGVSVKVVEHVLAAFYGLEIDNVIIELDGEEPPVLDGSAKPFVDLILKAGIQEQKKPKHYFDVKEVIQYSMPKRGTDVHLIPFREFRITFMVDFPNRVLGTQYTTLESIEEEFVSDFAPARTFGFLSEAEKLLDEGLAKGGTLENAIVFVDKKVEEDELEHLRKQFKLKEKVFVGENGILNNTPLRFYNEPCRHKVLDMLGDLSLLGFSIKGHIIAARSGHNTNIEFVKLIKKQYDKHQLAQKYGVEDKEVLLDTQAIEKILPHRYPFLLVDKIIDIEPLKKVIGVKNVTRNEPFFDGHFPGHPIMPGVLILESLAQTGGFLLLHTLKNPEEKLVYFLGLNDVKFRRPVVPGDQLTLVIDVEHRRGQTFRFLGRAFVGSELACEARLLASVVDKKEVMPET